MSKTLSAVQVEEFDSEVKQAYQGMSNLRNTVTFRGNVTAGTYNFRKMGKGLANQKAPQADVTPMDVENSKQLATLENWNAPEYTDIFDQAGVNFDEQAELAETIAMAIGRREDQLIIDAQLNSATTNLVGTDVGGVGTGLNVAKVRRASKLLNALGVPMKDRHILVSAEGLEQMLGEEEATSADYNTVKALVNGELNSFVGFQFHVIEERAEGGLPVATNIRTGIAYHKRSTGIAVGLGPKTQVDWVPVKTSWLANGMLKAGAVARDPEGIVLVSSTEV